MIPFALLAAITCAPAPGNITYCWDSKTGKSIETIERRGNLTHVIDPRSGEIITTCEDRHGRTECWPGR
jgi:hypothetical protein